MKLIDVDAVISTLMEDYEDLPRESIVDEAFAAGVRTVIMALKFAPEVKHD